MFHISTAKILEELQAEAIHFAEDLRSRRNPLNAYDFEKGTQDVQTFFTKVSQSAAKKFFLCLIFPP